ncbi:MAG: hypothetical protein JWQ04_1548 [Pedosphaera sp.]|nr:hypothetical protein [Pedosphaera sp.]
MKIIVLAIRQAENNAFEVELRIDGKDCRGSLTRDAKAPVSVWNPDLRFWECLKGTGLAPKYVAKVAGDFAQGKEICFPVDLGEF